MLGTVILNPLVVACAESAFAPSGGESCESLLPIRTEGRVRDSGDWHEWLRNQARVSLRIIFACGSVGVGLVLGLVE